MSETNRGNLQNDAFEEIEKEIKKIAQQKIKDYLMPLQTKKLSKKMIEQISAECAEQIAEDSSKLSRKASSRRAVQITSAFSDMIQNNSAPTTPVFNDKLATIASNLSAQDLQKIKNEQVAAQVVSRVYKSIFDFALEIGLKSFEERSQPEKELSPKE
jgi:hypothetical protein